MAIADLEIAVHRWNEDYYAVEMRFDDPSSEVNDPSTRDTRIKFDLDQLRKLARAGKIKEYGQLLTDTIFTPDLRAMFDTVTAKVFYGNTDAGEKTKLRVRLFVDSSASNLSGLRWETLLIPKPKEQNPELKAEADAPDKIPNWMVTNEDILFSRFLRSHDYKSVKLSARDKLKVLVVIANPSNLEADYHLNQIDVAAQVAVAKSAFKNVAKNTSENKDVPMTILGYTPAANEVAETPRVWITGQRATLANLLTNLREGYDILYLVCHGALTAEGPHLWLEKEDGEADIVSGDLLVKQLADLERRPTLVALSTCQSAGKGLIQGEGTNDAAANQKSNGFRNEALIALGPRLVQEGIPAVVAIQGNITVATANNFFTRFFQYLQNDCLIEQAMAVARGQVISRDDHWMPSLITRLKKGCMWYRPGFIGKPGGQFQGWNGLLAMIRGGVCTPILGSGLLEPFVGSTKEIANRWAKSHNFPLSTNYQDDLPQVAQYLLTTQAEWYMRQKLREELANEILRQHGSLLSSDEKDLLSQVDSGESLQLILARVASSLRQNQILEPHGILAALPFPMYITTNPDANLIEALKEKGKQPTVDYYPWREGLDWPPPISYRPEPPANAQRPEPSANAPDPASGYNPGVANPLVYYLFGGLGIRDSVVLSEDDYFDYLYGVTKGTKSDNPMPPKVTGRLTNTALLFIGFHLDDWDFRILFKSLMSQEGRALRDKFFHVGVQINPEEGRAQDPERARQYIERKFSAANARIDVNIYWGSVEDFMHDLRKQWNKAYPKNEI